MILKNKPFKVCVIILAVVIVLSILFCVAINLPVVKYNYAVGLIEDGDYQKAYEILYPLGDYEENLEIMKKFTHNYTLEITTDSKGERDEQTYDYYENGNLKYKSYYSYDDSKYEYEYKYDSENRLVKEKCVKTEVSGDVHTTTELYEYDENGRLKKVGNGMFFTEYIYDENGNFLRRVNHNGEADCECIYDEKGNLIQEKTYFGFGDELHISYTYTYDENNNIIKIEGKNTGEENSSIREGVYDAKGNLVKVINYTKGSDCKDIVEIEYDANGNIIKTFNNIRSNIDTYTVRKMTHYHFLMEEIFGYTFDTWFITRPSSTTEYVYDKKGNEIKSVTTDKEGNKETIEKTYNEGGMLIKTIITKLDGTQRTSEYSYDVYGNMLENIVSENGKVLQKTEYSNYIGNYKK